MATFNELIAQLNASSDNILSNANRLNTTANNMNQTLDGMGIQEVSGIEGLAPERTVGGQVYADQQINNQYSDMAEGDFGYPSANSQLPEQGIMSQAKNLFQQYISSGGLMGMAFKGIGSLLPQRSQSDRYMLDTYGGYGDMGGQDKYGYNIINAANNYMVPGSNSFRSAQLEGLRGLDQNLANQFYMDNYNKTYDEVYKDSQQKIDPFNQTIDVGSGADYYGGNDNNSGSFGSSVNDNSNFSDYS
jgi:hypothetical protein